MITTLCGTHGTLEVSAIQIQQAGFRSGSGRGGTGVYFWAYENEPDFAHSLARDWAEFRHKNGEKVVVIYVAIPTDEEEILDCDQPWFAEQIAQIANRLGSRPSSWHKIPDLIVKKMEAQGAKVSVLKCSLSFPKHTTSPVRYMMGGAKAYVVRKRHIAACEIISVVDC